MKELREWLRVTPKRFPLIVMMFSVFGLVWVIGDEVVGRGDFGTPAAGVLFFLLLVLSFVYGRGLQ